MRLDPRRAWRVGRQRRLERRMAGPRLLRAFADAYPRALFAEVGANDGEQHDLLRPLILSQPWRGIIVEPVPYVFERLKRNYRDRPGLALENVAIGPQDGRRTFYHLAEVEDPSREGLPNWYDGIGSFSRKEVLSHERHIPDVESRLVETEVQCLTLETLCRRNGVDRLDLLLIDTEGYDWEIIRHIDFAAWMPRLLVYEHYHLGPEERRNCREHVRRLGYETMEEHFDTFCLDPRLDDRLTRVLRRLKPAVPGVAAYEEAA
jgi:FkbM family methyltransferase